MHWTECTFVSEQDGKAEDHLICVIVDKVVDVNFKIMEISY